MAERRPNPDELLSRVAADEAKARRGRLKIFFGYAAGVGKTFGMLAAAHRDKDAGVDVVVGYVEPHGRAETEALLSGLEVIPFRNIFYRNVTLREFDLDAVLARKPELALVDELAHSNADGCRHAKRWQDVFELLDAGIDVYSTLNVQHIESLNDVIAQITGVRVHETLPDAVIDRADELELIDITPEELLHRLKQGKVYVTTQAERALSHFFQHPKLTALRELSLRQAARRLKRDVDEAHLTSRSERPWPTAERLLVCVGPSPTSSKLIRATKRMADALDAEWIAISVSRGDAGEQSSVFREQIGSHLRLAESLGAEVHQIVGTSISQTVLEYARSRNVTGILVGKSADPVWKRLFYGSMVDELVKNSGDIDVFLVKGREEDEARERQSVTISRPGSIYHWITSFVIVGTAALIGLPMHRAGLAEANIVMIFLVAVVFVSSTFGIKQAVFASFLSVLAFDLLFVPPYYSFAVTDAQYVVTFAVMLCIGLLISSITTRMRQEMNESQQRERLTHDLYRLSKQLGEVSGIDFLIGMAGQRLSELFEAEVLIYLRGTGGNLELRLGKGLAIAKDEQTPAVASWVAEHNQQAGNGTDTLPKAAAIFLPLTGSQETVGVVGLRLQDKDRLCDPDQRQLLETCVRQIALAIERDQMSLRAYESKLEAESERLRSSLLSTVSHDLRTPLSVISGASASLASSAGDKLSAAEKALCKSVVEESARLARLVDNLLDMTRLESSVMELKTEPHVVEDLIGSALARTEGAIANERVRVSLPTELILTQVDGLLIEQLLVNLIENADRYAPPDSPIDISAHAVGNRVRITVADRGQGITPGNEEKIFEKFFRDSRSGPDSRRGAGLGLAICKAIAEAHRGSIVAQNREGGGSEFIVTLPLAQIDTKQLREDEVATPT